jgi:tripeptide aminopeptidase
VVNPIVGDDFITTDGESILGADDKAGIAAILEALEILSNENQFQFDHLKVIFTVSEETGLKGAKALSNEDLKADYGFVLDGDGVPGTIYHRGPTQEIFEFKINGRAAHAGLNPEKGIHALQIAATAIAELKLGLIDPETVCNIGEFHSGKGTNIIPETAVIRGEVRSHDENKLAALKQKITKAFQNAIRGNTTLPARGPFCTPARGTATPHGSSSRLRPSIRAHERA